MGYVLYMGFDTYRCTCMVCVLAYLGECMLWMCTCCGISGNPWCSHTLWAKLVQTEAELCGGRGRLPSPPCRVPLFLPLLFPSHLVPFLHSVCLTGSSQPLIMAEIGHAALFPFRTCPNPCSWALDKSFRVRMGKASEEEATQARQELREYQRFSGSVINSI